MPPKVGEDKARELAGEQAAEARLKKARSFIRSEVKAALDEDRKARETEAARLKAEGGNRVVRPESLREMLSESGSDARNLEEHAEAERFSNGRYERAVEEVARKTGGRIGGYRYASKFQPGSRNLLDERAPSIVDRLRHGDSGPAIRTLNFFKALATNDHRNIEKYMGRALGEGVFASGGALVPEEFAADVITKMGDLTPLANREFLRVIPMGADLIRVPVLTGLPTATYGTENVDGTTASGSEPTWGNVELVAREALLLVPVSEFLVMDSSIELITYLVDLFADALARLRNNKLLLGSGSTEPEGVLSNLSIGSLSFVTTDTGTKLDSLTSTFFNIIPGYREGAIWVMSDIAQQVIAKLKATTFEPVMNRLVDEPFMRLLGKPVFTTETIGSATPTKAVFGNWKYYTFGDRMQMTMKTNDGGVFFKNRQIGVRVIERYDGRVGQPGAFTQLTGIQ